VSLVRPTIHDPVALQGYQQEIYKAQPLVLIDKQTAASSASLDFTSGMIGRFNRYLFAIDIIPTNDDVGMYIRVSVTGGATWVSTGSLYKWSARLRTGGTNEDKNDDAADQIEPIPASLGANAAIGNLANEGARFDLEVRNAENTDRYTEFIMQPIWISALGNIGSGLTQGLYVSTDTVDAIQFLMEAGSISTGTIKMYGITNRP